MDAFSRSTQKRSFSVKVLHQRVPLTSRTPQVQTVAQSRNSNPLNNQEELQSLLVKYFDRKYIRTLVDYSNREWDQEMQDLIKAKQFIAVSNQIIQRTSLFKPILGQFLQEYDLYTSYESKLLTRVNYKEFVKLTECFQVLSRISANYTDPNLISQLKDLEYLYGTLIKLYDPAGISSQEELRQKVDSLMDSFQQCKSRLVSSINSNLHPSLEFVLNIERIVEQYQRQSMMLRAQLLESERHKQSIVLELQRKPNFYPVQIDYLKIKDIKDQHKNEIMKDLDHNIVKFYKNRMKTYDKKVEELHLRINALDQEIRVKDQTISDIKLQIKSYKESKPILKDTATQMMFFNSPESSSKDSTSGYDNFIDNVNSPFKFNYIITSNFIHQLVLDKVLYDYEIIRHKHSFKSFKHFVFEWFIIKAGSKTVAKIFCKNFITSIRSLRKTNKRYELACKLMGISEIKHKSLMEDLELIFCQTQLAWYYYIRILLSYRNKFNVNNSGYPVLPHLNCQDVMKLPLRKTYELIKEFFDEEGIHKPQDLNSKFDFYCINQISVYKVGTEVFEKERKQEIHILREITFDTVAGFLIEYVANQKSLPVEKFLRALQTKVKQKNGEISYVEFELIFKKVFRQRRAKTELMYAKFVMTNQFEPLDVDNMGQVILCLVEDQAPLRSIFQKVDLLKNLILSEKAAAKWQLQRKTTTNANSYQSFRQRYYLDFYDFYSSVRLLYHLFRSMRRMINKFLREEKRRMNIALNDQDQSNQDQEHQEYAQKIQMIQNSKTPQLQIAQRERKKSTLEAKVEQFKILLTKIPIFPRNILTIDQLVIHSMRRKDSIDITQFSWRALRDILIEVTEKAEKS